MANQRRRASPGPDARRSRRRRSAAPIVAADAGVARLRRARRARMADHDRAARSHSATARRPAAATIAAGSTRAVVDDDELTARTRREPRHRGQQLGAVARRDHDRDVVGRPRARARSGTRVRQPGRRSAARPAARAAGRPLDRPRRRARRDTSRAPAGVSRSMRAGRPPTHAPCRRRAAAPTRSSASRIDGSSGTATAPRVKPSGTSTSAGLELVDRRAAEPEQGRVDATAEDVEHVLNTGLAVGGEAPQIGPADHRARAPSASALTTSLPRRTPPSSRTSIWSPTASTSAGSARIGAGARRDCCLRDWTPRSRSHRDRRRVGHHRRGRRPSP